MHGLTGQQILQKIIDGALPQPSMATTLSFRLAEVGEGRALFIGTPGKHILNPMGTVHGGWALSIIDSATGCAGMTLLPAGISYATVETHANLVRPIFDNQGEVRCEARVLSRGKTVMTAEATLLDGKGKLLAHGGSTLAIFTMKE